MKVKIICEDCGKEVELVPETQGNLCYVQSKLNNCEMYCSIDMDVEINSEIYEIKEMTDTSDIASESILNGVRFTCRDCGKYIELNNFN